MLVPQYVLLLGGLPHQRRSLGVRLERFHHQCIGTTNIDGALKFIRGSDLRLLAFVLLRTTWKHTADFGLRCCLQRHSSAEWRMTPFVWHAYGIVGRLGMWQHVFLDTTFSIGVSGAQLETFSSITLVPLVWLCSNA